MKENGSAGDVGELGGYLAKGTDATTGQDVALAMGEGAMGNMLHQLWATVNTIEMEHHLVSMLYAICVSCRMCSQEPMFF